MNWQHTKPPQSARRCIRRGNICVLAGMVIVLVLGLVAFTVDVGYVKHVNTQLRRAVDSGALAGAGALTDGEDEAVQTAVDYVQRNPVGHSTIQRDSVQVALGTWNSESRSFTEGADQRSAIQVKCEFEHDQQYFGKMFGLESFHSMAEAVAVYQPCDIMLVLDYSATMNDDSELASIARLGKATVEENLRQIYEEMGSPVLGNLQFEPVLLTSAAPSAILDQLGLTDVPYPFPAGSWLEYITYVHTNAAVNSAGYRDRFGYMTLVNYWLDVRPAAAETPGLWTTSEQPLTSVKDSVREFLEGLESGGTNDRVGLVIFTGNAGTAQLETGLRFDVDAVHRIASQRQAAHYERPANVAAGLRVALDELRDHARSDAKKLVVLVTDGNATLPGLDPQGASLRQAQRAADHGTAIVAVSIGPAANQVLLQDIAETSGGVHRHVPLDSTPTENTEDLKAIFREIVISRMAKIVN